MMAPYLQRPVRELWSLVWIADATMISLSCLSREDALQTAWELRGDRGFPTYIEGPHGEEACDPAPGALRGVCGRLAGLLLGYELARTHSSQGADLVTGGGASSPADVTRRLSPSGGGKRWPETHSLLPRWRWLQDPERWRRRAAEMRKTADGMAHLPHAQASLLETAREYDRRAGKAEQHLKKQKPRTAGGRG